MENTTLNTKNLMPLKIAMDLDGVIYDFYTEFRDYMINIEGLDPELAVPAVRWDFYADWGMSHNEYLAAIDRGAANGYLFGKGNLLAGSIEALQQLRNMNFEIIIITARQISQSQEVNQMVAAATEKWLIDNNVPYDNLLISNNKAEESFDIMIDDSIANVEDASISDRKAFIYDQPWNQGSSYDRLIGWDGVIEELSLIRDMIDAAYANLFFSATYGGE